MTQQELQYAYWERMRRQQLYRVYAAGCGSKTKKYEGLCFTAEQSNSSIKLQNVIGDYQTSTDGRNWKTYELSSVINLNNIGDKVYFAANNENDTCWNGDGEGSVKRFVMTGKVSASGNIQSLIDNTCERMDVPKYCYKLMFNGCSSLTKPPLLPATTLSLGCYSNMFKGCTSLTTPPTLSATILAERCYEVMFIDCSSLTATPELPATTLAEYCYDTMFKCCTSLSSAITLSSETLCAYCYANMFNGCTNLKIRETESTVSENIILNLKSGTSQPYNWNENMFLSTGGDFTDGTPQVGKTYCWY